MKEKRVLYTNKLLRVMVFGTMCLIIAGCAQTDSVSGIDIKAEAQQLRLAQAAAEGGNLGSAIRLYQQQLQSNPNDYAIHIALGNTYLQARSHAEAKQTFHDAAKLHRFAAEPYVGLGRAALMEGRAHEAHQYFVQAVARDENHYAALNGVAVSRDHMGAHREAQKVYRELMVRRPADAAVRTNLGLSLALSGHVSEAIQLLLSITSSPNAPPQAQHNLALAYALAGEDKLANMIWRRELNAQQTARNAAMIKMIKAVQRCRRNGGAECSQQRQHQAG